MKLLNPVAQPSAIIEIGVAGMSNGQKDEEMICALTADEHVALQTALRELPETMPPRDVWRKIREQALAEGLLQQPAKRNATKWYMGTGLAAAALLAAVMMTGGEDKVDPSDVVPKMCLKSGRRFGGSFWIANSHGPVAGT